MIPILEEPNTIATEHHTLFIDEVPTTFEAMAAKQPEIPENIYEKTGGFTMYKLFMGDFAEMGNGTQRIINRLQTGSQTPSSLEMHISSYGGSVDELLEYYHLTDSLYRDNTITYLTMGYSAGAIAFLFGTERIVYEHSDWMIHSYSGGAGGKREDMINQMTHTDARISKFFAAMLDPYFSKKEIKKISKGKDYWLNSEEMLERNIATHIISEGKVFTAQEYLEIKYPERKVKREAKEAKLLAIMTAEALKVEKEEIKAAKAQKKLAKAAKKEAEQESEKATVKAEESQKEAFEEAKEFYKEKDKKAKKSKKKD